MKIVFDKSWVEPKYPITYGEYSIVGQDAMITTLGDDEYSLSLEPLYKGEGVGTQCYTFKLVRDGKDLKIKGTITQVGMKDRGYLSVAKRVASKPYLQAAMDQIQSKWNKKKNKDGWRSTTTVSKNYVPEPQLLHRWDKATKREGPWMVGTKLDGIRSMFLRTEMYSRKRSIFQLPDIRRECSWHGSLGFDGEVYKDGYTWEEISGAVSRENDDSGLDSSGDPIKLFKKDLEYWVFDRHDMPGVKYIDRLESLLDLDLTATPRIHIIPAVYCRTEDDVAEAFDGMVKLGFEGACAYKLDGLYQYDLRSYDVLKIKPLFTKEFLLVSVTFDEDAAFGKLIAYNLVTAEGMYFKATPASSKEKRAADYKVLKMQPLEDMWMTCEYRDSYANGKPKFAVAKGFRNPADSINDK